MAQQETSTRTVTPPAEPEQPQENERPSGVLSREPAVRPRGERMSWGAIFGGAVAALGLWMMLSSFGVAVGLTSIDPQDPGSLKSAGMFTGIWNLVAAIAALLVGGLVAGRAGGAETRVGGALHGLVMWGLAMLAGAWLAGNILSSAVNTAVSVGSAVAQTAGAAVGAAASAAPMGASSVAQAFGLDAEDALAPVNQRLRDAGKPTVTAAQLESAAQDAVQSAIRRGKLDRAMLVQSLASNTALTRADAEDVATRIEAQFNAAKSSVSRQVTAAGQSAQRGLLSGLDATGKVFWGLFGALFLSMIAALGGGVWGAALTRSRWAI